MNKPREYSPEYYACGFVSFLKNPQLNSGLGLKVEQHANKVIFYLCDFVCNLEFFKDGSKLKSNLEVKIKEDVKHYILNLNFVQTSKSGRISGNNFEGFYEFYQREVLSKLKLFHQELNCK
jgi:hypothetical protein